MILAKFSRPYLIASGVFWILTVIPMLIPCTSLCEPRPGVSGGLGLLIIAGGLGMQAIGWPLSIWKKQQVEVPIKWLALATISACIYIWISNSLLQMLSNALGF